MGQKPKVDEINFNYPIPRKVHKMVRQMSIDTDISVKDIVINALMVYVTDYYSREDDSNPTENKENFEEKNEEGWDDL